MFRSLMLTAALVLVPASAAVAGSTVRAPHTPPVVKASGLEATFHVDGVAHPAYTCSMHPEVARKTAGDCPVCGMHLSRQTHRVGVEIVDAARRHVAAKVRLVLQKVGDMEQSLDVTGPQVYAGDFMLTPGTYRLTAYIKRGGTAADVAVSTPYEVR